jgi:integrase
MRLTKTVVDRLTIPATGQAFYRDDVLKGFAVRVTAKGAKSFIVEKRIDGRVRRKTLGAYGVLTVEQGRQEAQKFLGDIARGIDPYAKALETQARQVTLQAVFDTYMEIRKGLSPATVHDYHRLMKNAFSDWVNRPLAHISKDAVAQRHKKLGQRSPARANNAMRLLRALFNFARGQYEDAEGRSLFLENPVSRLSHTRAWYPVARRRTVIKRSQLPAWFEAVMALKADPADSAAVNVADYLLLLLFTGLRRSEGMRLQWKDVDLVDRTLTIHETKNGEPLTLPLSDFLMDLLAQRAALATSEYVFPGEGEYGHLIEPRKQMNKVIKQSGVTFILHDLRRTFITVAESLETSVYAIKRLVNHKMSQDVTAGYVVMDVERLRTPMQKITDRLLEISGEPPKETVVYLDQAKSKRQSQ